MSKLIKQKEFDAAKDEWKKSKRDYKDVSKLVIPSYVFELSREDCTWLEDLNDNKRFNGYLGVHDKSLILIIVPLDSEGKEIELDSYVYSVLQPMKDELVLKEKDTVVKVKKTKLSKDIEVESYTEEIQKSVIKFPNLNERTAVQEILAWKYNCLDWFYEEVREFKGKRIVEVFSIPIGDIKGQGANIEKVVCLFGFKKSIVYEREVPILIFVGVKSDDIEEDINNQQRVDAEDSGLTNELDFSTPCPPFCRPKKDTI